MTSWVLGFLFSCIAGTSVYQKASFLSEKLGARIGNPLVDVVDDGLIPGELGSRPFDSDGVPCRRTVVVDKGVLRNFLCNVYAARKLGLETTGNADGGGVSPHNFSLAPGTSTPEEIVRSVKDGLLLTRTLGHGLNSVTGDISRGAFGLWIEDGEVAFPVSEDHDLREPRRAPRKHRNGRERPRVPEPGRRPHHQGGRNDRGRGMIPPFRRDIP